MAASAIAAAAVAAVAAELAAASANAVLDALAAEQESPCWEGKFNFASCCLDLKFQYGGSRTCWGPGYDYQRCCQQESLFSKFDLDHLRATANSTVGGVAKVVLSELGALEPFGLQPDTLSCPTLRGAVNWDALRRSLNMRAWSDAKPYYVAWVRDSTAENVLQCPLGAVSLVLLVMHLTLLAQGVASVPGGLEGDAGMRWVEKVLRRLSSLSGSSFWLRAVGSGWPLSMLFGNIGSSFEAVSVWQHPHPLAGHSCAPTPALRARQEAAKSAGRQIVPIDDAAARAFLLGGATPLGRDQDEGTPSCRIDVARRIWAAALLAAEGSQSFRFTRALLREAVLHGSDLLNDELQACSSPLLLLATHFDTFATIHAIAQTLPFPLHLSSLLGRGSGVAPSVLQVQEEMWPPFDRGLSFSMRLFPRSEVISDSIRFNGAPVCGLRPFIGLVANAARASWKAGCPAAGRHDGANSALCHLTVLEGGANLGSCLLWAAAALRASGGVLLATAVEPMLEAYELFATSVLDQGLEANIVVERLALAAPGREQVQLEYWPGRHGQASLSEHTHSGCGPNMERGCEVENVGATTVDASWGGRFGPSYDLDVLKLNVNGEELNALRGARRLLSRRGICVVMMHVFKVQYAFQKELEVLWRGSSGTEGFGGGHADALKSISAAATDMHEILVGQGQLELYLHLDPPVTRVVPDEAVRLPLDTPAALQSVLQSRDEDLATVAEATLGRKIPFGLSPSQVFLIARTPSSHERCRLVAHEWMPT